MKDEAIQMAMAIMAAQHGVATDGQLAACGLSDGVRRRMISKGLLLRHAPWVVASAATALTWHRRAMAATLAPGGLAVLCGAAAARLHGLDGFADIDRIIVTVPHGTRLRTAPGVTVVQCRSLRAEDITTVDGIPTLTVAATLVSLARVGHSARSQALDAALRDGALPSELRAVFVRHRRRGARGLAELISMLDERVDARLPRSWFQRVASELLARHGIDTVDEWVIRDDAGNIKAELDLARPELKVGLECQSWQWHGTPTAQRRDTARKRWLRASGWDVIELWWSDLDHLDNVVADFRIAVERAERLRTS